VILWTNESYICVHLPNWNGKSLFSNLNGSVFCIREFSIIDVGLSSALEKSIFRTRSMDSLPIDVDCSWVLIDEWSFVDGLWPLISSFFGVWEIWIEVFVQLRLNDTFDSGRSVVVIRDESIARSELKNNQIYWECFFRRSPWTSFWLTLFFDAPVCGRTRCVNCPFQNGCVRIPGQSTLSKTKTKSFCFVYKINWFPLPFRWFFD